MSADLHIHIFDGINEGDLADFFSNTIGSKYFSPTTSLRDWSYKKVANTPNIWIGEVSWLKAALFDNEENYIPDTVARIQELIGESLPVIDDELIKNILDAFNEINKTFYKIAKKEDVEKFLKDYKGKKLFTVSW